MLPQFNPALPAAPYALPLELVGSPCIKVESFGEIMRGEGAQLYRSSDRCKYKLLYPPGYRATMTSPFKCELYIDKGENGPVFKVVGAMPPSTLQLCCFEWLRPEPIVA